MYGEGLGMHRGSGLAGGPQLMRKESGLVSGLGVLSQSEAIAVFQPWALRGVQVTSMVS